jgi:hypothetical protein
MIFFLLIVVILGLVCVNEDYGEFLYRYEIYLLVFYCGRR